MRSSLAFVLLLLLAGCAAPAYKPGNRAALPDSEVAPGVRHHEDRFDSYDGTSLLEQSWSPAKSPRAVFVLVHGLKDHSDRYGELAVLLAKNGIAVRAFDLRGHGDSAGDRVWIRSFDDYIDDLKLFMSRVEKESPGAHVFLFGHSMGGAIVTRYAIQEKPKLSGLILSAPALKRGANVSGFLAGTAKFLGTVTPSLAVLDLKDEDFSRDPKVVEAIHSDPLVYDKSGPARTGKELLKTMEWIEERMPEVQVPLLILHGTDDRVTNPEGSRELYERAGSKDRTLRSYPGLFHDLLHEPEKVQVQGDILSWVENRLK